MAFIKPVVAALGVSGEIIAQTLDRNTSSRYAADGQTGEDYLAPRGASFTADVPVTTTSVLCLRSCMIRPREPGFLCESLANSPNKNKY